MPLALVRHIDDAVAEYSKWKIGESRKSRGQRESGGADFLEVNSSPLAPGATLQICISVLSPVCLAIVVHSSKLVDSARISPLESVVLFCLVVLLSKLASRAVPFQDVNIPALNVLLEYPALIFKVQDSNRMARIVARGITLDSFLVPIISHLQNEISDREEIHYIVIGFLLMLVYDITIAAVRKAESLLETITIGFELAIRFEIFAFILLALYIDLVPVSLLSRLSTPSWFFALCRWTLHDIVFAANRWLRELVQSLLFLSDRILYPFGQQEITAKTTSPYQRLSSECIRLLKIQPNFPSAPISCDFIITTLSEAPGYEAISYVWGDQPYQYKSILVDGLVLPVTSRAYDIIHRRRSRFTERLIWIDQVSINQSDLDERSEQVQLMGRIFRGATLVSAWLGESLTANLLQSFIADLHFYREGMGWTDEQIKYRVLLQPDCFPSKYNSVAEFFRNDWFFRMWIVQEAASARRLHVMYGNVCMDWIYIGRAVATLFNRPLLSLLSVVSDANPNIIKRRRAHAGMDNADTMLWLRGDIDYEKPRTLAGLLELCTFFDCSDPRDKIYSLLGLSTDCFHVQPNYRLSEQSVFTAVMKYFLLFPSGPLTMLENAGIGHCRQIQNLPSWVPDWSFLSAQPTPSATWFAAGMNKKVTVEFEDTDPHLLSIEGVHVDSIVSNDRMTSQLGPLLGMTKVKESMTVQKWIQDVKGYLERMLGPYRNNEEFANTVFRTMIADQLDFNSPKLSAEECARAYDSFQEYFLKIFPAIRLNDERLLGTTDSKEVEQLMSTFERIMSHIVSACAGRKICITEKRRMAVVPAACEAGDVFSILYGCPAPYVLRPLKSKGRQEYQLVGCCYLQGCMESSDYSESTVQLHIR